MIKMTRNSSSSAIVSLCDVTKARNERTLASSTPDAVENQAVQGGKIVATVPDSHAKSDRLAKSRGGRRTSDPVVPMQANGDYAFFFRKAAVEMTSRATVSGCSQAANPGLVRDE